MVHSTPKEVVVKFHGSRWLIVLALVAVSVCFACSKKSDQAAKEPRGLTEAQRDSAIAASKLPGAGAVGKALEAADSAAARADESIPEP
jgi:hypothetical protein